MTQPVTGHRLSSAAGQPRHEQRDPGGHGERERDVHLGQ
jgi:hypothetical protein